MLQLTCSRILYTGHSKVPIMPGNELRQCHPRAQAALFFFDDKFPVEGRKSGSHGRAPVMKSIKGEEDWGEQSAGAYMPAGRKYGKRRPASFSSIRFELLSSRRALSIVAENYFIIARSAGLEYSRREPA